MRQYRVILLSLIRVRLRLLGIAAGFLVTGCSTSPVSVSNCSVRTVDTSHIRFQALVGNGTSKTATNVYVLVTTTGVNANGSPGAVAGSAVEYRLSGPLQPGQTLETFTVKNLNADTFSLGQRLGSVSQCEVHAVEYSDGSHWEGPSPL